MTKKRPKIGAYCRVSTRDKQTTRMQRSVLTAWAKTNHVHQADIRWYVEKQSGRTVENRPVLQSLLRAVDAGKIDCLVCYKLDRLARSTQDGLRILADLGQRGIRVVSVQENIDFNSSTGMLIASILLSVAQFSRETIVQNIRNGMQAAKEAGKHCGRPRNDKRLQQIRKLFDEGMPAVKIGQKLQCSRSNVYAALKRTA